MGDSERIDRMLNQLREVWVQVPQWRLGQLILNALSAFEQTDTKHLYNVEDDKMEKLLAAMSKVIANRTTGHIRLGDLRPRTD
ncbi:MAG TPA: hypothetical protein VFE62_12990 [Gemmataceae bacterium]|nr:hypothetical protein [Pirellulales bacterium]HZZ79432.1 hypothetical protein [Gemmataceae bacterium]